MEFRKTLRGKLVETTTRLIELCRANWTTEYCN